jgi:small-conductance mechanosensitive channel
MEKYIDPKFLISWMSSLWHRFIEVTTNTDTLIEVAVVLVALIDGVADCAPFKKRLQRLVDAQKWRDRRPGRFVRVCLPLLSFFSRFSCFELALEIVAEYELPTGFIYIVARLLTAWLIIRLTTAMLKDSNWARLLSVAAWIIAALHILNLLVPVIDLLDRLAIDLGGIRISMLLLIKGVIVFTVLLKLASSGSSLLEKRILSFEELTPSMQVLLSKALKITLLAVAVIVALSSLGINLSAFAFIGGAIGVGVGFGLQKVVSNLVSGVILLLDRSIKPGDVIGIGSTYGRIQSLGARYVSVATRDKTEYLIPNEDLITTQVVNWSFSDKLVRLKVDVGVSYDSDIHVVMQLMVEAAATIPGSWLFPNRYAN